MSPDSNRLDRIAELIQRKLSQLILQEIKDPRLPPFVTISSIRVSAELSHARVYFTQLNGDIGQTTTILNGSARYLRTALARSVKLHTVPQLHFVYDETVEYARRLSQLIDKANLTDTNNEKD